MKKIQFILTALLIGFSFIAWGQNTVSKQEYDKLKIELKEEQKVKAKLEKAYSEAIQQLEENSERNKELNALIDKQKEVLTTTMQDVQNMMSVHAKDNKRIQHELSIMKESYEKLLAELAECKSKSKKNE